MPRSAGPGFRRPSEAGIIPVARENASERKDRGLPSLARRLLPVIAFALVLSLVMAGVLGHTRSRLGLPDARPAHSAGSSQWATNGAAADLSATVGAIPGADGRADGRGRLRAGALATTSAVAAKLLPSVSRSRARPLSRLLQADVLVVAGQSLPAALVRALRRLGGVAAAVPVDAGRVRVNGVFVNVLGVKPATFRPFAARPTARSAALWQNVTAGGMAISYTMGHQDRLTQARPVQVTGSRTLTLPIAGFGTVGIGGNRRGAPGDSGDHRNADRDQRGGRRGRRSRQPGPGPVSCPDCQVPGRGGEPGRAAVCLGRRRPEDLRLLRAGAVVDGPGWRPHAARGRRSSQDRAAAQAQRPAPWRPALLSHRSDGAELHLACGYLHRQRPDAAGPGAWHECGDRGSGLRRRVRRSGPGLPEHRRRGRGKPGRLTGVQAALTGVQAALTGVQPALTGRSGCAYRRRGSADRRSGC